MVTGIGKLFVEAEDVPGAVLIGNCHDDAVGKTDSLRLIPELLQGGLDAGSCVDEDEVALWPEEAFSCLEGSFVPASPP